MALPTRRQGTNSALHNQALKMQVRARQRNAALSAGQRCRLSGASPRVHAQANDGGGACFPLHFDSDPALDSRRVTALFYLNRDWCVGPPAAAPHRCSCAAGPAWAGGPLLGPAAQPAA